MKCSITYLQIQNDSRTIKHHFNDTHESFVLDHFFPLNSNSMLATLKTMLNVNKNTFK